MHAVILAGGAGSRLWPCSSLTNPKPFIHIEGSNFSLLQDSFQRTQKLNLIKNIITITGANLVSKLEEQYNSIRGAAHNNLEIIVEPTNKDTAAAIIATALYIAQKYGSDERVLILPSDHRIANQERLALTIDQAIKFVDQDKIVIFGIIPTSPNPNYGYINFKKNQVIEFIEKPDIKSATKYINSKNFLWNSGMLCFKAGAFINEVKTYCRELFNQVKQTLDLSTYLNTLGYTKIILNSVPWNKLESKSIDYALMEKLKHMAVVKCDFGWQDVGNWKDISKLKPGDDNGNNIDGNAIIHQSSGCYIKSNSKVIAVVGVKNLVIIETDDGFLVVDKEKTSLVKDVFSTLNAQQF